jgi:hypothetical protein
MFALYDAEDASRVADWIELELSLGSVSSFSKSKLTSVIAGASGVEVGEAFASDVWRQLQRRVARYSANFLEIRGDLAIRRDGKGDGRLEYQICLFFSLYGAAREQRSNPKLFERMAACAVNHYVGGHTFVFGWPVLPDIETQIGSRVRQVCELLQEKFIEAPAPRYKDRGVDIISWKAFPEPYHTDRRSGQFVLLSQCAAGHDWRTKTRELPMASWIQYIQWATDPIRGFAVPCVIDDDLWHDVNREVEGLVFDRVRLLNSLPKGVNDPELRQELETWQAEQIEEHCG